MTALLDTDQLRSFIAIADTGTFTRAAEAVHKTQSAVSMQIKRLEEVVGRPLFERDGRASRLTDEGERLLDYARRIVRLSNEALASFAETELAGRVRLGLPDDYAERYLPEILARFSQSNPRVEVTVVCEPTPMLMERIEHADIDLAIITHVSSRGSASVIRRERLLWVTSGAAHDARAGARAAGARADLLHVAAGRDGRARRARQGLPSSVFLVEFDGCGGRPLLAGLAVSVLPESALRSGMRVLGAGGRLPHAAVLQNRAGPQPRGSFAALRRAGGSHRVQPRQSVVGRRQGDRPASDPQLRPAPTLP